MAIAEPFELEKATMIAWREYAGGNKTVIEDLYARIMPYCLRICSRTCGRYIDTSDEEASIARVALLEAFEKFEPQRGSILLYLGYVIRNRIIDYKRREEKRSFIPLSAFRKEGQRDWEIEDEDFVEEILEDLARKQDIDRFTVVLAEYDITLEELAKASPRQNKTLDIAVQIAETIAGDEELAAYLVDKKMIPIRMLEQRFQMNRKVIDRYRKFIIASTLILLHDIDCLKNYILARKGGEADE